MSRLGKLFNYVESMKESDNEKVVKWRSLIENILDAFIIPLAVSIITLFIGAISDNWPSQNGRRKPIMKLALIPFSIGSILYFIYGFYPVTYISGVRCYENDKSSESSGNENCDTYLFYSGIVIFFFARFFWKVGKNTISIMFRSYILDEFDTSHQDKVNLVKSFMTGFAYFLWFFILLIVSLILYDYDHEKSKSSEEINHIEKVMASIMFVFSTLSDIIMIGSVFIFSFIVNEDEYDASRYGDNQLTKMECIKQSKNNVMEGLKSIELGVFCVFIVVFLGWIDWYSFIFPIMSMGKNFLYPGEGYMDDRILIYSVNYTFLGLLVMIESFVLYVKKWRLEIFTFVSYGLCSLFSLLYLIIQPNPNSSLMIGYNYVCSSIPFFFASMLLTSLKSFPYSLMRDFVPKNRHGITMVVMTIFIDIGKFTSYVFITMFDDVAVEDDYSNISNQSNDKKEYLNQYTFLYLICFISFVVSVVFWYLRKSMLKQKRNEMSESQPLLPINSEEWN